MCQEGAKPIRSIVLFEGQVKWIMERETAEERLAAWETIAAIAFPEEGAPIYTPPSLPSKGKKLSPSEKTRRDVYNLFKDIIESRAMKTNGKSKDIRKVEAGRLGAAARYRKAGDSTVDGIAPQGKAEEASGIPLSILEDDFSGPVAGRYRYKRELNEDEKEAIEEWNRKIPDAKALQKYLMDNYLYQNKMLVVTDDFCQMAYKKLAIVDKWISARDKRPYRDIRTPIHYLALDYVRRAGEIRRAEEDDKRKNQAMGITDNPEYAEKVAADRRKMKQLEREAAKKGLC